MDEKKTKNNIPMYTDNTELAVDIGRRIRQFREKRGYSINSFAQQLDISFSTMQKIEYGYLYPSAKALINMHQAYGVDIYYILFGIKTFHRDILHALQGLSREELFDIYNRLYVYFSCNTENALLPENGSLPLAPRCAGWDGTYFRKFPSYDDVKSNTQFKPITEINPEDDKE